MVEQLLSKRQVFERLSISKTTLDCWRRSRAFPAPIQIAGLNRWRESDIEQWLANAGLIGSAGLSRPVPSVVVHQNSK